MLKEQQPPVSIMQFPNIFNIGDNDPAIEEGIFFDYELDGFTLDETEKHEAWIKKIIEREGKTLYQLSYIFADDDYVLAINYEHLQHDTYTDIITFPYADDPNIIHGDIFISIDRVRENATTYQTTFENELRRVIIHGVLHLCGYFDKTPDQAKNMRHKEDEALVLFI